jgi:hypothetical protein
MTLCYNFEYNHGRQAWPGLMEGKTEDVKGAGETDALCNDVRTVSRLDGRTHCHCCGTPSYASYV